MGASAEILEVSYARLPAWHGSPKCAGYFASRTLKPTKQLFHIFKVIVIQAFSRSSLCLLLACLVALAPGRSSPSSQSTCLGNSTEELQYRSAATPCAWLHLAEADDAAEAAAAAATPEAAPPALDKPEAGSSEVLETLWKQSFAEDGGDAPSSSSKSWQ